MPALEEVAMLFEQCRRLEPASRGAFLGAITDRELSRLLRELLQANARAERTGFLSPHPH